MVGLLVVSGARAQKLQGNDRPPTASFAPLEEGTTAAEIAAAKAERPPGTEAGSSATAQRLEPPRLLTRTPVPYPETGSGDATVVLELLVSSNGEVTQISVISGVRPFSDAARSAAQHWHFEPARVDGVVRPARIRISTQFVQRETSAAATKTPATIGNDALPPTEVSSQASAPFEVTVHGQRPAVGSTTLSSVEIRELPGAFGDPFRAVEALPGVTPMLSGLPFFFIRGAPPGNQGFYFDGIRVPLLYHLALGPGVIDPELVERVELHPGAYPARYGRVVGGIVAAESAPPEPKFHGHAMVRLIDSGGLISAPFADGRGTALVSGRYSYTARMVELIEPSIRLQYWDYQARTTWQLGNGDSLEALGFGSFDFFRQQEDDWDYRIGTEFHRLDFRYNFTPSGRTHGRVALTLGADRSREEDSDAVGQVMLRDRMVSARVELEHVVSARTTQRGGADVTLNNYDILSYDNLGIEDDVGDDAIARYLPSRNDLAAGGWSDAVLEVAPRVTLVVGGRVDVFVSGNDVAVGVDPRVSASFEISERVRLVHAFGISHQPPSFVLPVPGFAISDLSQGLQRGAQASAGLELTLPADFETSLVFFDHAVFNGTDLLSMATQYEAVDESADPLGYRTLGHTYGAELMLRRAPERKVGGFLAYTLSHSTRSVGSFEGPSSFDRRHVLNAALALRLGHGWRLGARCVFYTGIPVDVESASDSTGLPSFAAGPAPNQLVRPVFTVRTKPYYRLDWRVQKRWRIGRSGAWWGLVMEVLNTTLNKEEVSPACPDGSCNSERIGPVTVPAIGVEAAF